MPCRYDNLSELTICACCQAYEAETRQQLRRSAVQVEADIEAATVDWQLAQETDIFNHKLVCSLPGSNSLCCASDALPANAHKVQPSAWQVRVGNLIVLRTIFKLNIKKSIVAQQHFVPQHTHKFAPNTDCVRSLHRGHS